MRRNTVSVGMAVLLLGLFVTALETPVVAQSFPKDAGNATDVINPYSPRFGHPYRRGVVPKRETHQNMKAWREQNIPVHRLVTTGKAPYGAINALQGKATKGSQTLAYNGGVDAIGVTSGTPKVYLVFWGTQWGTKGTDKDGNATFSGDARGAAPYMQKWLKGLGTNGELWSGVMTQYCDGPLVPYGATSCPAGAPHIGYPSGGALAGVWYDNSAAAPASATGNDIAKEAVKAAAYFGNTTAASNRYAQYIIMSPSGTNPDGWQSGGFCAWHDWNGDTTLTGGAAASSYGDIAFTNMPYVADAGSSCGAGALATSGSDGPLQGFSIVGGHEYAETITDQNPSGGWINITNSIYNGQENGDECAWISSGQGATAFVQMATGSFAMQSTWSNDTNRCDISHPIATNAIGAPVANFSFKTTGLVANFTDQSTDTGGTIGSYAWSFGDGGTASSANPSHTYAAAGTYQVTETITDLGSAQTNSKTQTVSITITGGKPVANFSFSATDLSVSFTDASTDTGSQIGAYQWSFGDGTTSTSANPTHVYLASGTYTVTETVTDRYNGARNSVSKSVSVATSSQILSNTGFEAGSITSPWTMSPGVIQNYSGSGPSPHSGTWFAWLDGYGMPHTDTLTQSVTIPARKKTATLKFYLNITTQEIGTIAYDRLSVQILSATGSLLKTLAVFSNADASSGYVLKTFDVSSYIGQSIRVQFKGVEDSSLPTSFIIDDVTLTVQ